MAELIFDALSPIEWETERDEFDFHIRLEQDDYVIDVFDTAIESADDAHLTTHTCESWEYVVAFCANYDGVNVL